MVAQVTHSQSSIKGLPEALLNLLTQIQSLSGNSNDTAIALQAAIDAEIAARGAAITTLGNALTAEETARIASDSTITARLDVIDGDSSVVGSFRKAIADVIGQAPEALNTLKEIADYIAVNPDANVAAAINAAIATANTAVTNLTTEFTTEKTFLTALLANLTFVDAVEDVSLTLDANGKFFLPTKTVQVANGAPTTPGALASYATIGKFLSHVTARVTHPVTGVSYDLPISSTLVSGMVSHFADTVGYEAEFTGVTTALVTYAYVYTIDSAAVRTANGAPFVV